MKRKRLIFISIIQPSIFLTAVGIAGIEAVPQINYRTLLYIKTMTLNKHKSEIHDTPGVNTNKILKNCYLRCKISYQSLNIT